MSRAKTFTIPIITYRTPEEHRKLVAKVKKPKSESRILPSPNDIAARTEPEVENKAVGS